MILEIDARRDITINEGNELIFVAMEGREGGQTAIEANFGLVAFGESKADLIADIRDKVRQHGHVNFIGKIRLREFTDTVFDCY